MALRFFVDENDLALGKRLARDHEGIVFPGHPDLPDVPRGTPDDKWISVVGASRLVVITRDRKIRYRPVEKMAWVRPSSKGLRPHWPCEPEHRGQQGQPQPPLDGHPQLGGQRSGGPWMRAVTSSEVKLIDLT